MYRLSLPLQLGVFAVACGLLGLILTGSLLTAAVAVVISPVALASYHRQRKFFKGVFGDKGLLGRKRDGDH
jgi:hypothetical protein